MFDIAGTAVTTGSSVFKDGKLDTALMASGGDLEEATRKMACDLGLRITLDRRVRPKLENWEFKLEDDHGGMIDISIVPRSSKLCLCTIDVGLWGSEPLARLMLARMMSHLPKPATQAATETGPAD
jgi:hypothetical protein